MNIPKEIQPECNIQNEVCLTHDVFVCIEHLMHMYSDEYGWYCPSIDDDLQWICKDEPK